MPAPTLEDQLTATMTMPLETIVDVDARLCPPDRVVSRWELPEADRSALITWGLPNDELMTPSYQAEPEPMLTPNVAGDEERRLVSPHQRLYDLGGWGSHDLTPRIGAVAGDGRVLAVRERPLTADDLHPALREHYQGLYQPAVAFINSSVTQLVEVAWRWRKANTILRQLEAPHHTASSDEITAYCARVQACEQIVLDHIERIDSQVRAGDEGSLWSQTVTDPGY